MIECMRAVRVVTVATVSLGAALAAGCAGRVRPATVPVVAPAVVAISLDARLLEMVDQRRPDTALVDTLLADGDATRRARTALAIGQARIQRRYPRLRQLLLDGDTAIAANAAYALGIAKDFEAVPALARALAGAPDPVAREAAWALGEMGEMGRTVITMALGDEQARPRTGSPVALRVPAVRAAVVLAAVKLRTAPIALVTPWLADSSAQVVRAAAYVVARLRAPAGVRAMLAVRSHPDEEVRQYVARAAHRAAAGDSLGDSAHAALRVLLRDASERVRVNAVQSAASYGPRLAEVIEPLLRDAAPNVRVATAEVFAEVGARDVERWQRAWSADTLLATRRVLLQHVRRLALPLLTGVETAWAGSADWRYRVAALGAGEPGAAWDSVVARRLQDDPDPRVRRTARARLGIRDSVTEDQQVAGGRSRPPAARPLAEYEELVQRYWRADTVPRAYIDTEHGTITLELFAMDAPLVVEAFTRLARQGLYRNTIFHRVVPNFVVQDGDISRGGGEGAPAFSLRESWSRRRHGRGCLGLATAGPDTGGSQYYLCHSTQPHLDGGYTVFGRVIDGFEVMDRVVQGDHMLRIRVP
jgi:cyclophilin family peptidyl-prolyl cis-trans isomerase/HEAT repeat protein